MNIAILETFLAKNFQAVEHRKPEQIITARLIRSNCTVAIFFFDYSEHILDEGFNIEIYQENHIAEDYYRQSSSLQWNLNLVFVLSHDRYRNFSGSPRHVAIEADHLYSRKQICSIDDLDSLFPLSTKSVFIGSEAMSSDLTVRWSQRLAEAGLRDVLSEIAIAQVVREIIEPPSGKAHSVDIDLARRESDDTSGNRVQLAKLEIEKYRRKPAAEMYKLGAVNLLSGPNGAGKTSFLEAIELCLCGRTYRGGPEPESKITYWVRGSDNPLRLASDDNRLHQSRDLRWYNNRYARGNNLPQGFNKFNFYDTDQAYRLAYKTDPNEIRSAFASLALGERANFFDERIRRVRHGLSEEFSRRQDKVASLEVQIQQGQSEIRELSLGILPTEPILEVLANELRRMSWQGLVPDRNDDSLANVEVQLVETKVKLQEFTQALGSWILPLSKRSIVAINEKFDKLLSELSKLESDIQASTKSMITTQTTAEARTHTVTLLKRALEYASIGPWNRFLGIDERVAQLESTVVRLNRVFQLMVPLDFTPFRDNHTPVVAYLQQLSERFDAFQAEQERMDDAIVKMRIAVDRYSQLKADLRQIGLEIISLRPSSDECPLCHVHHSTGELKDHVQRLDPKLTTSAELEKLNDQRSKLTSATNDAKRLLDSARMIQRALCEYLQEPLSDQMDFTTALATLNGLADARKTAANERDREVVFRESLKTKRLSEEELRSIEGTLAQSLGGFQLQQQTVDSLTALVDHISQETQILRQELITLGTEREHTQRILLAQCQEVLIQETDINKALLVIRSRATSCRRAVKDLRDIESVFRISDSLVLADLLLVSERALGYLDKLKQLRGEAQSRTKAVQFRTKAVEKTKADLAAEGELLRRIKAALEPLEYIVTKDNKEQALESFFATYKDRILQIFRTMHSPKEFDDISISDSVVTLHDVHGRTTGLNKISTGQRSALALSIFLSLNASLQDGPSMVLIDDPVANVDDINCVAFLDFLREFVFNRKRQLFFATANARLANLFTKKFDFLSDDFAHIVFK